jgi:catalase
MRGFTSFPEPIADDKVRGRPERFAEHFAQATLFWESQTSIEKAHIRRAFRFELTKVQSPGIRERVVSMLANVSPDLAEPLAFELGMEMPAPMPRAMEDPPRPEVERSPPLSLFARPGDGQVATRRIAILVADGVDTAGVSALREGLLAVGAVPRLVGIRLGTFSGSDGDDLQVDATLETTPSVLYDAVVVPDGKDGIRLLGTVGHALEFLKDQYRHCKPMLALGAGADLIENAGIPSTLENGDRDPGLLLFRDGYSKAALTAFLDAVGKHRHHAREVDPPGV